MPRKLDKAAVLARIYRFLKKQGKQAVEKGVCQYKTSDGLRCGVGALIPPRFQDPAFDEDSSTSVRSWAGKTTKTAEKFKKALAASGVNINDKEMLDFLSEIQNIHDCLVNGEDFRRDLAKSVSKLAKAHKIPDPTLT